MPALLVESDDPRDPGVENEDFYLIIDLEQEAAEFQETILMNDDLFHLKLILPDASFRLGQGQQRFPYYKVCLENVDIRMTYLP